MGVLRAALEIRRQAREDALEVIGDVGKALDLVRAAIETAIASFDGIKSVALDMSTALEQMDEEIG